MLNRKILVVVVAFGLLATLAAHADTFYTYNNGGMATDSVVNANVLRFLNPMVAHCQVPDAQGYCEDSIYSSAFGTGSGSIMVTNKGSDQAVIGLLIQATFNPTTYNNFSTGNDWVGSIGGLD